MDLSKIENFKDAVVTVMGLGRYMQGSGLGTAKWLMRHGAQTVITDMKDTEELKESVATVMEWYEKYRTMYPDRTIYQPIFVLGQHRREDFENVDCVVQNPGVPSESEYLEVARQKGINIESDVSLFFRYFQYPIMAVTGTRGKTTTTLLVADMLKTMDDEAFAAGNIRVSPLEYLDDLLTTDNPTPVVLELSSWLLDSLPAALRDLGRGPEISVVTNVYPDHLNRYASFADYQKSKEIIFAYQSKEQHTILNYEHDIVHAMQPRVRGQLWWFSKGEIEGNGCGVEDGNLIFQQDGQKTLVVPLEEIALKGEHNLENIASATCAALVRGVPLAGVQRVLRHFKGVPDRQELIREVNEIAYINDTAATSPDAVVAAIKHFGDKEHLILICGGVDKKLVFDDLAAIIPDKVKTVILFPGSASEILQQKLAGKVAIQVAISMKEAVQKATALATTGDVVLLSPGAASFNMFKNEFDRGEQFREEVRNL